MAYGLVPGYKIHEFVSGSYPNYLTMTDRQVLPSNSDLAIFKIPPVTFDSNTQPIMLTDCSGGSGANIGDVLTIFGLGDTTPTLYNVPDRMQVKCFEVEQSSTTCDSVATTNGWSSYFCGDSDFCNGDNDGPIVAYRDNTAYLVSMVPYTSASCDGKFFQLSFLGQSRILFSNRT